jgi:hypothetical protein
MASQIFGNLFAAYVFKSGDNLMSFYLIMSALAMLSCIAFVFCTKPEQYDRVINTVNEGTQLSSTKGREEESIEET